MLALTIKTRSRRRSIVHYKNGNLAVRHRGVTRALVWAHKYAPNTFHGRTVHFPLKRFSTEICLHMEKFLIKFTANEAQYIMPTDTVFQN